MRKAWMIAALVLLALSVSGCANADYSEGTPSSEETAMTEPVQSIAPQEHTTVSVSESTEIATENAALVNSLFREVQVVLRGRGVERGNTQAPPYTHQKWVWLSLGSEILPFGFTVTLPFAV